MCFMDLRKAVLLAYVVAKLSQTTLAVNQDSCYRTGTCPSDRGVAKSGFTNNTGWKPDGSGCCDICAVPDTHKVNCFDPATCGDKTGNDDWDFLVLDQIWLPQLCRALEEGHDPTLTHMSNARCQSNAARRSGLSIHGLWPNYINGFPQCCKHIALPEKLASDLAAQAEDKWVDPTEAAGDKCGACSMWAHEMMKHGTCLTTNMTNYMQVTFALLTRLTQQTSAANTLLTTASHTRVPTEALKQVFSPFVVQMLCDGKDERSTNSTGVFLELRTCWNRTEHFSPDSATASSLFQIDCPGKPVGDSCPEFIIAPEFDSYQMV